MESCKGLASHMMSKPMPNAEPKPVAIALIIVAERGDLTIYFIRKPPRKEL